MNDFLYINNTITKLLSGDTVLFNEKNQTLEFRRNGIPLCTIHDDKISIKKSHVYTAMQFLLLGSGLKAVRENSSTSHIEWKLFNPD